MPQTPPTTGKHPLPWLAPTKLNLFLHIIGRIETPPFAGYHELQTYFQLIDYGDRLMFTPTDTPGTQIIWTPGEESIAHKPARMEDDLIHRAATLLQTRRPSRGRAHKGMKITLQKNTPVGGGMGGGSSAAATTLIALNHYWELDIEREELQEIGLTLGADVPVFIEGRSAWAEGIGERLTPLPSPVADQWFVIVVPDASSWTQKLFAHPELPRSTPRQRPETLLPDWQKNGFNAFERILLKDTPTIRGCFDALQRETGFARITGSGACLFTPVPDRVEGNRIAERIRQNTPEIKRVIIAPALRNPISADSGVKNI